MRTPDISRGAVGPRWNTLVQERGVLHPSEGYEQMSVENVSLSHIFRAVGGNPSEADYLLFGSGVGRDSERIVNKSSFKDTIHLVRDRREDKSCAKIQQ